MDTRMSATIPGRIIQPAFFDEAVRFLVSRCSAHPRQAVVGASMSIGGESGGDGGSSSPLGEGKDAGDRKMGSSLCIFTDYCLFRFQARGTCFKWRVLQRRMCQHKR